MVIWPEIGSRKSKGQHAIPQGSSACWGGHVKTVLLVFQNPENFPSHLHIHPHTIDPCQCSRGLPTHRHIHVGIHVPPSLRRTSLPTSSFHTHTLRSHTYPAVPREGGGRKPLLFHCSGREDLDGTLCWGRGRKKRKVFCG